ncbi:MAG TPA: hypothetical protein VGO87_10580 [Acidimicrobiia bacterium]
MLEGLDAVEWRTRSHAFGEASNLPSLLRRVAAGGSDGHEAVGELFNTVWHQGTVYDATAVAVPFVGELAGSDDVEPDLRELLMALLFAIGRGQGYWEVHRASAGERLPHDLDEQLALEESWVRASREAVAREASTLLNAIDRLPERLWLPAAVLTVVAGHSGQTAARLLGEHPPLPPFGALGVQAIGELLATGRISADLAVTLEALDDELADFTSQREETAGIVTVDSYFVDVLCERLCDSRGWGSQAPE